MNLKINNTLCLLFLGVAAVAFNCSGRKDTNEDKFFDKRKAMVQTQIKSRGIQNKKVLDAFFEVPRHKFVPEIYQSQAYDDSPLEIGYNQTISQPYVVAYMTEILNPDSGQKILEIGTGSGYQAAILSKLYKDVYTIEIIKELGERAKRIFDLEGYQNIRSKIGDGYMGWKEYAPYDAIIVTCAPDDVPEPLLEQLAEGGRMVIPVGNRYNQVLYLLEKRNGQIHKTGKLQVIFVPMQKAK